MTEKRHYVKVIEAKYNSYSPEKVVGTVFL